VLHEGSRFLHNVHVSLFQNDFFAGALAAGLFARLLRPTDHNTLSEGIETIDQNLPEATAVGD